MKESLILNLNYMIANIQSPMIQKHPLLCSQLINELEMKWCWSSVSFQ